MKERMSGYYKFTLTKGDIGTYRIPGYIESVNDGMIEYMPHYNQPKRINAFSAMFSYQIEFKNNDLPVCFHEEDLTGAGSTFTARADQSRLPTAWRFDEGGCWDKANPGTSSVLCFTVAIPSEAAAGAHEIWLRIEREQPFGEAPADWSEWYPLWICVDGPNSSFNYQTFKHDRSPAWECSADPYG